MKDFVIVCLLVSLMFSVKYIYKLNTDVAIMNWALETVGLDFQMQRKLLANCREQHK